jgi:sugar lactone lactonase YvrE
VVAVKRPIARWTIAVLTAGLAIWSGLPASSSSVELQTVVTFDAHAHEYPEGVAIDASGNVYVSLSSIGEIRRIATDGTQTTLGQIHVAGGYTLGIALGPDRTIYIAVPATPAKDLGLWAIASDGTMTRLSALDPKGFPNDVVVDAEGNAFVSDSSLGAIWRVTSDGGTSIWIQHPLLEGDRTAFGFGANGLELRDGALFVNNTSKGSIVRIPIRRNGTAGRPMVFFQDPALVGADGLAFDSVGNAYITTDGLQNTLVRVSAEGTVQILASAEDGLDYPASVAFGTGVDTSTLFIANVGVAFGTPSFMKAFVGDPA